MKTKWRKWMIIGGIIILVIIPLKIIFFPPGPHIECHRVLDGAFHQWMMEHDKTNAYPNIDGNNMKSLMVIAPFSFPATEKALRDYIYIPGLRDNDPHDLVLLYVKEKTRRKAHTDYPTIFREKKWIVIDPGFSGDAGELNDWVTAGELKNRIQKTLDYLKINNRPNWQAIVAEQTKLLESVHD